MNSGVSFRVMKLALAALTLALVLSFASLLMGTGCGKSGLAKGGTGPLRIVFSPMYSSYDGVHVFQIPAVVEGLDNKSVVWSASDPSFVTFSPEPKLGGVIMTVHKAGMVTVNAALGARTGSSTLNVTAARLDLWETGRVRYEGNVLDGGIADGGVSDGGIAQAREACTVCHGPRGTGPFQDVSHTPAQAGGFSDEELTRTFTDGVVPDGGYFDTTLVSYADWRRFHHWTLTSAESQGIVVYLRGLTPTVQTGTTNSGF